MDKENSAAGTITRGQVRVEHGRKRVRAYLGGELAADTASPLLVWEVPYYPAQYFPASDVLADLVPTGTTDHSPGRGADIFDLRTPTVTAPSAVTGYRRRRPPGLRLDLPLPTGGKPKDHRARLLL
jgi:uncharacterized protein (DUF427 family)